MTAFEIVEKTSVILAVLVPIFTAGSLVVRLIKKQFQKIFDQFLIVNKRFDKIDEKFEKIYEILNKQNERLSIIETRYEERRLYDSIRQTDANSTEKTRKTINNPLNPNYFKNNNKKIRK